MSPRGRHSSRSNVGRDAAIMVVGVLVIGAIVYGILWGYTSVFDGDAAPPTTRATATTVAESPETSETAPDDTTTTSTTVAEATTSTVTPRDPSEIVVLVLNSVGTEGLASDVSARFEELGYQVLEPDDYEPALERSQILFRDGYGPEAFELAAVVPDAEIAVNPDPDEADIVVLLGSSFDG
jgi:LytR cell envelope-related transcriptional attenuator